MDATIGANPSYIWCSLLWIRDILQTGIFWKIGNGANINTKKAKWIPTLASGRIISNTTYDNNVKVSNLIRPSNEWDSGKLKALFLPYEIEAI